MNHDETQQTQAPLNATWIISDEQGTTILMIPTPSRTLVTRLLEGPGHVVREHARQRRAEAAMSVISELAGLAERGRAIGTLEDHPSPKGVVALTASEAHVVASGLRRIIEHIRAKGLPPAGTRAAVVLE